MVGPSSFRAATPNRSRFSLCFAPTQRASSWTCPYRVEGESGFAVTLLHEQERIAGGVSRVEGTWEKRRGKAPASGALAAAAWFWVGLAWRDRHQDRCRSRLPRRPEALAPSPRFLSGKGGLPDRCSGQRAAASGQETAAGRGGTSEQTPSCETLEDTKENL